LYFRYISVDTRKLEKYGSDVRRGGLTKNAGHEIGGQNIYRLQIENKDRVGQKWPNVFMCQ